MRFPADVSITKLPLHPRELFFRFPSSLKRRPPTDSSASEKNKKKSKKILARQRGAREMWKFHSCLHIKLFNLLCRYHERTEAFGIK
jgi:hypothetical protein